MDFDLENPLSSFKEQQNCTISELFALETDHMPSSNCLNSTHCEAISLILQVKIRHFQFLFHFTYATFFYVSSGSAFLQFGSICSLSWYKLLAPFYVEARIFGKHISNEPTLCLFLLNSKVMKT